MGIGAREVIEAVMMFLIAWVGWTLTGITKNLDAMWKRIDNHEIRLSGLLGEHKVNHSHRRYEDEG